jgi:hypothetical protein
MDALKELVKGLPPDLKQEVEDFARFLLERRARKSEGKAEQDEASTVRDHREQYASSEQVRALPELVQLLPSEMQQEVRDFIEFLLEKRLKKPRGKPTFEWAGALKDLRDQYTSVELQHKISDWRISK